MNRGRGKFSFENESLLILISGGPGQRGGQAGRGRGGGRGGGPDRHTRGRPY